LWNAVIGEKKVFSREFKVHSSSLAFDKSGHFNQIGAYCQHRLACIALLGSNSHRNDAK